MGVIKALLVGVSEYPTLGCEPLPLCKNDLYALKDALIKGLNVDEKNIVLCGESGKVVSTELILSMEKIISNVTNEDTFIFYFSGHGGKNCLALSDKIIELQKLIDMIEKINTKNKIIILDSCHSGSFSVNGVPQIDITETVENFAGHGYAVLASCGAEQFSGFNGETQISLYTSFVCNALTYSNLIREGKKSLEEINKTIFHFAKIRNEKYKNNIQEPLFRSNIGGTIFFDVEQYTPYKINKIYEETDNYIIYAIDQGHNCSAKRLYVKVILRFKSSNEQIADISLEIKNKVLYYEVYQNKIGEEYHKGKAANVVICYFGYDEDDIVNPNFICHSTWIDNSQDKNLLNSKLKNTIIVNGVRIDINNDYEMKKLREEDIIKKDETIKLTKEYTVKIISLAEQFINYYREYLNNTITEEQLIDKVSLINNEIHSYFKEQTDLPKLPTELDEWANANINIACIVDRFYESYHKKNLDTQSEKDRKLKISEDIKKYQFALEELKNIEKKYEDKL